MALYGSGTSTAYWSAPFVWADSNTLPNGRPAWLSYWIKVTDSFTQQFAGAAIAGSGNNTASWGPRVNSTNPLAATVDDGGIGQSTGSAAALSLNTWYHLLQVESGTSSRTLYQNGVSVAVNSGAAGTQTLPQIDVGRSNTNWWMTTGKLVAEVAVGFGTITAAQIAALAAGQSPLAAGGARLAAYFPLKGSLNDLGPRRVGLAPTNNLLTPVWGEHPPVTQPPIRRRLQPSVAGTSTRRPLIFVSA